MSTISHNYNILFTKQRPKYWR